MLSWIIVFTGLFALSSTVQSAQRVPLPKNIKLKPKPNIKLKPKPKIKHKLKPKDMGQGISHTVDRWFYFWSKYAPPHSEKHLVSRSKKPRKIVLDYPQGYVIVDKACQASLYESIPANTWVDHNTGMIINDDHEISRIEMVEGQISWYNKNKANEKIDIGYLTILDTAEKRGDLDVQIVDDVMTLSAFMKKEKAGKATNKPTELRVNGWSFKLNETKEATYGVGVKGKKSLTLYRQHRDRPGIVRSSNKDLVCSAIEQKDDSLQVYTFDGVITGKQMAQKVLVRELSNALGRAIQLKDITWVNNADWDNKAMFVPSATGIPKPLFKRNHQPIVHRADGNRVYSEIPFERGQLKNIPLGCLHFGISKKENRRGVSDRTGAYYVYVDYVVSKEQSEKMDRDLLRRILEKMSFYRFEKVNGLSYDEKKRISKPVSQDGDSGFGNTHVSLFPSSECGYDHNRCSNLGRVVSPPVQNQGIHFTLPTDEYGHLLENGGFYAYSRVQSGMDWKEELRRMAENIENADCDHNKNARSAKEIRFNEWNIIFYTGENGVYGFADNGGRTISFCQVKNQGMPVNIIDIFYKAWKIFNKNKNVHLFFKLKNNETEPEMVDILNNTLFELTGQHLNHIKLQSEYVQDVPFKMATVVLKTQNKITGILKYGISDQSRRPGSPPMMIIVGNGSGLEKKKKTSSPIEASMVGLLEKDLGMDFSCLAKGFGVESPMDSMAFSPDVGNPEGIWKSYTQLALSGL